MDKTRIIRPLVVAVLVLGLIAFYALYLGRPLTLGVALIAALGFGLAFVDTAIGMGFGTMGTPILLIVGLSSTLAVPSVLIAQGISALLGFTAHHRYKNVDLWHAGSKDKKIALVLVCFGIVGTILAVFVALQIPKVYLNSYIGLLIIAMGVITIANSKMAFSWLKITAISIVSGFNKALSGGGYGPVATTGLVVSGHPIKNSVGITLFTVAAINFVAFGLYLMSKSITNLELPVFLTVGAVMGSQIGPVVTRKVDGRKAKIAFAVVVIVLGMLTIATAIWTVPALVKIG